MIAPQPFRTARDAVKAGVADGGVALTGAGRARLGHRLGPERAWLAVFANTDTVRGTTGGDELAPFD
jgi:hypothetical protein